MAYILDTYFLTIDKVRLEHEIDVGRLLRLLKAALLAGRQKSLLYFIGISGKIQLSCRSWRK